MYRAFNNNYVFPVRIFDYIYINFVAHSNKYNAYIQGSLLPLVSNPSAVALQDYRDAIKAALDVFKIESSANTLDTALLTGVKSDICAWVC